MKPWKVVITTVIALLLAFAALAYAIIAPEGLSARKKPSNFEYAIANFALALSIQSHQKTLKNPLSITPADLSEAKEALHGPLRSVPRKGRQRQDRNERRYVA